MRMSLKERVEEEEGEMHSDRLFWLVPAAMLMTVAAAGPAVLAWRSSSSISSWPICSDPSAMVSRRGNAAQSYCS